ncbi:hypothetical protein, variant [Saprolegnia diclina VS20]|uniref:F-box domain-containing protein n=1 Tax=Saprolegnia diclina (strain VS20) TaxID=1156394 RepID=T0SFW5_SAPDV|nr:hypothetical protein, variant [Saprolegnia diclina VS20]EQC41927.1 hypothetical protein, variant [Saprolegnia diclina VS20]|eukprot:XP_008604495.1 hypothetical protein, variant [Saprolegnia diclina VS20]
MGADDAAAKRATFLAAPRVLKSLHLGRDYGSVRVLGSQAVNAAPHGVLSGLCVHSLNHTLLVCDVTHACIRVLDVRSRAVLHSIGSRGGNPGKFIEPVGIAFNALNGHFAVSDAKLNRIQVFSVQYELLGHFGKPGAQADEFQAVAGLTYTPDGHHLVIADRGNHRVKIVTPQGGFVRTIGGFGDESHQFNSPCDVAVNRRGELFVADRENNRVSVFSPLGEFILYWLVPSPHSVGIATEDAASGDAGDIVVCDAQHLRVFSQTGLLALQVPLVDTTGVVYTQKRFLLTQLPSLVTFCAPYTSVAAGALIILPVAAFEMVLRYLSYQDAIPLRQTNRFFHRTCKHLRDTWQLFPLTIGESPRRHCGVLVAKASGLKAIHVLYAKWGEQSYAAIPRPDMHGLHFASSFQSAICEHFGPMFWFQHEPSLLIIFQFYADADKVLRRKGFLELVTVLTEIQANVLEWHHCRAFADARRSVPLRRKQSVSGLERLEAAQNYQLDTLVSKLRSMV